MTPPKEKRGGPLNGVRVLEIASIGPGPYCCMLLSDMGAEVLRVDRIDRDGIDADRHLNPMNRGRKSVALDLKADGAADLVLGLCEKADILVEGFRPGVMEKLGLGPDVVHARNPRLLYGRMTGWGQDGPRAKLPGHDLNYIALSGVLAGIGKAGEPPVPPLNLIGDFGGAVFLAFGLLAALHERTLSGCGQVVDAAMVDAAVNMMTTFTGMLRTGKWTHDRGSNLLDGGAPFYRCYETKDGEYFAVGAIEGKFFEELLRLLNLPSMFAARQYDRATWPEMEKAFADAFRSRTRDEWAEIFAEAETCATPVLTLSEAAFDAHLRARQVFSEVGGVAQPMPAPRLSRTPGQAQGEPVMPGTDTVSALASWDCDSEQVQRLLAAGALHDAAKNDDRENQ